ncbi:MAG: TolC family protein [Armatimonadota bacterium]
MIRSLILFALICTLAPLCCKPISAGATTDKRLWTLEECIRAGLENRADILTCWNNLALAQSRERKVLSEYFPRVSVENNAFTVGSVKGVLTQATTGTAISVRQNIFDGGFREASVSSVRHSVKASSAELRRIEQTAVYDITRSYFELLRAKRLTEVALRSVEYSQALRDQVQAMIDEKLAAPVDLLAVEAHLANARVSLLVAQNQVRVASIQLQNQMGLAPVSGFDVVEPSEWPKIELQPLDFYIARALNTRPDIEPRRAGLNVARAGVRSARISLYPRPVVTAEYQHRVFGGYTSSSSQIIGGFVFDLFDGGANLASYREAEIAHVNAGIGLVQVEKDIRAEVEEAYLNLTNARERLEASAVSVEAARKNYEVQKEMYAQGLGTTLDMLNAEVQLVTAQTSEVQAQYDYYVAIAQMKHAVGTICGGSGDEK